MLMRRVLKLCSDRYSEVKSGADIYMLTRSRRRVLSSVVGWVTRVWLRSISALL